MISRFRSLIPLVAAGAMWLSAPSVLADQVSIRVGTHDGYGRIVFGWPRPVAFTARVQGRQLIVEFQRPVESSLAGLPGALNKYVRRPRSGNGGRTLTFPLTGNFDLRSFPQGRAVIVDLLDPEEAAPQAPTANTSAASTQAAAATTPAPAAARPAPPTPAGPASAEKIGVRTGLHPNYTRLVFDWAEQVDYSVKRDGQSAAITFSRSANVDLSRVNRGSLPFVGGARTGANGRQTIVNLSVPVSSRIRHFRSGTKVVVDVNRPTQNEPAPPPPAQPQLASAPTQPAPASPTSAPPPAAPEPPTQSVATAPPSQPSQPAAPPVAGEPKTGPQPLSLDEPEKPPAAPVPLTPPNTATAPPTPEAGASSSAPPTQTATPDAAPTAPPPPPANVVATLRLDWEEPVAAAAFRRAGNLWLVFDKAKPVDIRALREAAGPVIQNLEQVASDRATILRIRTAAGINPRLRRDGFSWLFDFGKQPLIAEIPIRTQTQFASGAGPRVFLPVAQAGGAIPFPDPEVGDNLVVVPVIPLGHGIATPHLMSQFRILASAQGVVVQPRIDQLRIRPIQTGIELSSTEPLALSSTSPKAEANANISGGFQTLSRVFPPDSWRRARREGISKFNATQSELLFDISKSDPVSRKQARMKLALFYFGNLFGPEALGVLRTIADDPDSLEDPQFRLLRGGVNHAMRRYKEARADLNHASLQGSDEAAFWLAAVDAASGRAKEAAPALRELAPILRAYPRALKINLGMLIANTAIEAGDVRMGISHLEAIAQEEPTPREVDQLANIEGKLKQLAGDFDGAVAAFEAAEEGEHRRSSAEATVARADLLLTQKRIRPREAIEELEKLRFSWRGDDFEFRLLRKLGQLYLAVDDYRNGLRTLRQAVTYFRENPRAKEVTKDMSDAFIKLYLQDAPNDLSPVRAIALYEEFKELTPAGAQGDEMIRKLADRLAEVDLLDRAAALLEQQVSFRLQGVQRAQVGARLATIYLLNREAKRAEQTLKKSESSGLPDDLARERRQLLARAVVEQGRRSEGLDLIEDDETREADLLRVGVFWRAQEWANAAKVLQRLVVKSGIRAGKELNQEQARNVLNLAVSMTLSANERGLARLRDDHSKEMAKTTLGGAFKLIASPNSIGLIDYRTITGQVKEVADFGSFLTAGKDPKNPAPPPKTN